MVFLQRVCGACCEEPGFVTSLWQPVHLPVVAADAESVARLWLGRRGAGEEGEDTAVVSHVTNTPQEQNEPQQAQHSKFTRWLNK